MTKEKSSILKTIGGLTLVAIFSVIGYLFIEVSALATKQTESDGKLKTLETKYEAEKPVVTQRMESFETQLNKFESKVDSRFDKVDNRFDKLETKMDTLLKRP